MAIKEYCDRCGKPLDKVQIGVYRCGVNEEAALLCDSCDIKISLEYPLSSEDGINITHDLRLCPKCAKPVIHMIEFLNDNLTAYMERSEKRR